MLVVEDLHRDNDGDGSYGYVGFCGAVGPQAAANATAIIMSTDVYVCGREGREVDRVTAGLLVRALRGWIGGPEAAAAPVAVRKWSRSESRGWLHVEGTKEEGGEKDGGEMVDWVDTRGKVISALSRNVVHARNVLHRGAGVMIRNKKVMTVLRGQVCIMYALYEPQERAQGGKYFCGGTEQNIVFIRPGAGERQ